MRWKIGAGSKRAMVIFPPGKKKSRKINLHEHFSLGCHRQSNTFPACTRRLAQEKSQETGLEGAKGKVERRNVTGRPRYGPLRKANFLVPLSSVDGAAAFIPPAMATTFLWNNARYTSRFRRFVDPPRSMRERIESVSENRWTPSYGISRPVQFPWNHLISSNFGSNRRGKSFWILFWRSDCSSIGGNYFFQDSLPRLIYSVLQRLFLVSYYLLSFRDTVISFFY